MGKGGGSAKQEVHEYRLSIHYGIGCEVDAITRITVNDEKIVWQGEMTEPGPIYINEPGLFGGPTNEGGMVGIAYFLPGRSDQVMPDGLAGRWGLTSANCPGFRGVSSVFFVGSTETNGFLLGGDYSGGFYWTANSPFIQPISITARRAPRGLDPAIAMIGPDANPIHIIYECLTDTDQGMGAASYQFDLPVWDAAAHAAYSEGFGLSLKWTQQTTIEAFISEVIDHVQATFFVNPRTGLMTIKMLRDDYDIGALREVNPDNADFTSFSRKMWGDTANEISVSWTNPDNEETETVTAQDLANIAAQGAVIADSRNYYGIRNSDLAARVAARDVRASSAPLALIEARLDRRSWDTLPGEVMRVNWPEKKINGLIMRVMKVDYGKPTDPQIKVVLMEDIFSLTKPLPRPAPTSGWDGAAETPAPMDFSQIFTLPAFLASSQVTSLTYPEVVAGVLANKAGNDTAAYNLYAQTRLPNGDLEWQDGGVKSILGRATLSDTLYVEAVTAIAGLPMIALGRGPSVGGLAIIGDGSDTGSEIVLLRGVTEAGVWSIDRGVLDTVPREWPVNTPVWFLSVFSVISDGVRIRSAGEEVEYKLLTRTSRGRLALNDAPIVSTTLTARPHLPLRPANVKIEGAGFGEIDATGKSQLVVTWSTRNRLFEDGQALKWTDGAVTPETGQDTVITIFRSNNTQLAQVKGLWTAGTFTIPMTWILGLGRVFVRVESQRDGLSSLQSYGLWVKNIPAGTAAPPSAPVVQTTTEPPPPSPPPPPPPPSPQPPSQPTTPLPPSRGTPRWQNGAEQ